MPEIFLMNYIYALVFTLYGIRNNFISQSLLGIKIENLYQFMFCMIFFSSTDIDIEMNY